MPRDRVDRPQTSTTDVNDQPINFIRDVQDSCIHVMLTAVDIHVHADNPPPFRMQLVLATLFLDPFVSTSINLWAPNECAYMYMYMYEFVHIYQSSIVYHLLHKLSIADRSSFSPIKNVHT